MIPIVVINKLVHTSVIALGINVIITIAIIVARSLPVPPCSSPIPMMAGICQAHQMTELLYCRAVSDNSI